MTKSPGIFDEEKLLWLNSHYLKEMPAPELARELTPFLAAQGITEPDQDYLAKVVPTLSARSKTLVEMAAAARFYFLDPRPYEEKAAKKFLTPTAVPSAPGDCGAPGQFARPLGGGLESVVHRPGRNDRAEDDQPGPAGAGGLDGQDRQSRPL